MRAFEIPTGTTIKFISDRNEWQYNKNWTTCETKKPLLFFVEDLRIDPTGISRHATVPGCVTIGSAYADAGYYGFQFDHPTKGQVVVVVHSRFVKVC